MFKKEYLFVFIIIGLSIVYALLSLISFLIRGKWLTITNKKIAIGAAIVAFTAILNFGSVAYSQEVTPDPTGTPTPVYGTAVPTPVYGTLEPTVEPLPEYGVPTIEPTADPSIAPLYGIVTPGDVNTDLNVDIIDALLISQYYVGLDPSNFDTLAADVDCSGKIDIVDALLVAQLYVGLISELPSCDA